MCNFFLTQIISYKQSINHNMTRISGGCVYLEDAILGRATKEKNLRVTLSADMKVSEQCGIAASKSNNLIGELSHIRINS